jgi:hypothetical protein
LAVILTMESEGAGRIEHQIAPDQKIIVRPLAYIRPAGEQKFIGWVFVILWVVGSIRTTRPLDAFMPICGIER